MKRSRLSQILLASALLFGSASFYSMSAPAQVVDQVGDGKIDWTNGQVTVTGSGAPPANGSAGQKRLMAQRAAQADAYRQLAELLNGVNVDAETTVRDFVTESDVVKTKVSALIKGARIGKYRYLSDGTVEVDMTLRLYGPQSVSQVIVPPALVKNDVTTTHPISNDPPVTNSPEPQIVMPTPPPNLPAGSYSGVIVDCRGTGVQPAMSPQIVDTNGKEIYIGTRPIDPDLVVNIGIVGYAENDSQARANANRIGNNPLILKAVKAGGRHKTDAVIAADKGQALVAADSRSNFLGSSRVIFIVDK